VSFSTACGYRVFDGVRLIGECKELEEWERVGDRTKWLMRYEECRKTDMRFTQDLIPLEHWFAMICVRQFRCLRFSMASFRCCFGYEFINMDNLPARQASALDGSLLGLRSASSWVWLSSSLVSSSPLLRQLSAPCQALTHPSYASWKRGKEWWFHPNTTPFQAASFPNWQDFPSILAGFNAVRI
jgi:hypothetical protein